MEATATVPIPATTEVMTIWARERAMRSRAVGVDRRSMLFMHGLVKRQVSFPWKRSGPLRQMMPRRRVTATQAWASPVPRSRALDAEAGSQTWKPPMSRAGK